MYLAPQNRTEDDGQLTVDESTDETARAEDEGRTLKTWVRRLDEKCQCRSPGGTTSPNILPSCLYALTDQPWKFPEPENEEVVTEYRALPRADPLVFEEVVNGTGYGRWH